MLDDENPPMPQRNSIRRIVGAIIAVGLLAGAVNFALDYRRMDREFYKWFEARPLTVAADLSQPSTVTAPFHQTCQVSHGEAFYLTIKPASLNDGRNLLDGLAGTITIKDAAGNEVQSIKLAPVSNSFMNSGEPIMLEYFHPFANGEYTATINVESGAASLRGREQTIHAQYHLCGMERMPATISAFLAIVCGIPGLIIGVIVAKNFIKHGWAAIAPPRSSS